MHQPQKVRTICLDDTFARPLNVVTSRSNQTAESFSNNTDADEYSIGGSFGNAIGERRSFVFSVREANDGQPDNRGNRRPSS